MRFAVTMFPASYAVDPITLAKAAEERGFEALFFPEHTHIPVQRETPWAGGAKDPPPEYSHTLDPFVALSAAAAATTRLRVGTGICLVIQRDPIVLAKEVASLDHLSNGRFLFGVGAGWLREEIANHGTDPRLRWRIFEDRMRAMETIWSNDEAEYHGPFVSFDPIWSWPKPVQKPRPRIYMGGDYRQAMLRVIDFADEWMPHPDRGEQTLRERIAEFHSLCEAAGKPPMPVTLFGTPIDVAVVESYIAAGATRTVFRLSPASADQVIGELDRAAEVAARFA
jgi:probable F420-dependent oxidoreductase